MTGTLSVTGIMFLEEEIKLSTKQLGLSVYFWGTESLNTISTFMVIGLFFWILYFLGQFGILIKCKKPSKQ